TNLYAATMRFWRFSENGPGNDLGHAKEDATAILDRFEDAAKNAPDDARIPAFSGLAHTFFGNLIGEPARVDLGEQLLQEGIDRMPQYGHFLRALSTGPCPKTTRSLRRPSSTWTRTQRRATGGWKATASTLTGKRSSSRLTACATT